MKSFCGTHTYSLAKNNRGLIKVFHATPTASKVIGIWCYVRINKVTADFGKSVEHGVRSLLANTRHGPARENTFLMRKRHLY
jgi:hypothetical protein